MKQHFSVYCREKKKRMKLEYEARAQFGCAIRGCFSSHIFGVCYLHECFSYFLWQNNCINAIYKCSHDFPLTFDFKLSSLKNTFSLCCPRRKML